MALSWNEIKKRSIEFSREWESVTSEKAEAKTFWDQFFNIFGLSRRRIASFEEPVKKLGNKQGYIDLFWKGMLIVEHKSSGKSLDKAYTQALDYFPGITENELPKYVLVSDFVKFRLYDLEENSQHDFTLKELHKHVNLFGFVLGYKKQVIKEEDPVNIKAAELMGRLHDALEKNGYTGHKLEVFLVRILFCLFADDTGIFNPGNHFSFYIENKTKPDGSDLGIHLSQIFEVLNLTPELRQKNLDEDLDQFPHVNGQLFAESLPFTSFDSAMRAALLGCCQFDWSKISPAIFGSLFQSVMDKEQRRDLGAHYTSEKNIMKVIKGLFLDELHNELEEIKNSKPKLEEFHNKLASLKFLDPACGCGNFLIISYREIRLLEIEVLKRLSKLTKNIQTETDVKNLSKIYVDCMYGIEYEEFPARIAEVAMWLIDHQMNLRLGEDFGGYFARLPLKKAPHIVHGNALRLDWNEIVPKTELSYILGNPPFVSKKGRSDEQNEDMDYICFNIKNYGLLDYVTAWYIIAEKFITNTNIKVAFVSTNSITQVEQVGTLWQYLLSQNVRINFAHRTFKWSNEAKGIAQVFVVIIGFSKTEEKKKYIFDYDHNYSEPQVVQASNINPYLIDFSDIIIVNRSKPICNVKEIVFGSMPNDGGFLLMTDEEKVEMIKRDSGTAKFIRRFMGGEEFLYDIKRWCLWLKDVEPSEIRQHPVIENRIRNVQLYREKSTRAATVKLSSFPSLFGEIRQPKKEYLVIPLNTSGDRKYIPLGRMKPDIVASNLCSIIENGDLFIFGILSSTMHMSWINQVCGRLGTGYRYSNRLVYNNFPWPESPTEKQTKLVEEKAQGVLETRKEFPESSLADMYDPIAMPPKLVKAHKELDKAVDACYSKQTFTTELSRLGFLFHLYKKYTAPMFVEKKGKKKKV
jgi:hypothetical protein